MEKPGLSGKEQILTTFETWRQRRLADFDNKPENQYAAERSALDQALHPASLKLIEGWSPPVAREIANHFFDQYKDVFYHWVKDNSDLAFLISDKRQKQILVLGRKLYGLSNKIG